MTRWRMTAPTAAAALAGLWGCGAGDTAGETAAGTAAGAAATEAGTVSATEAAAAGNQARPADLAVGSARAPDGVEIRYEVAGTGEPALVLVHGWSCDRTYWRPQVDHFAGSRRVVAVDLGGHGESGLGRTDWTMPAFGADVRAAVEALDLRSVVLVGHSMGGAVVAEAARLMPDRVAAVILVDTFHEVDRPMTPEEREEFMTPLRGDFRATAEWLVRELLFAADADPALVDRIVRDMADAPPAVGISAMENLFEYDEATALAALDAPMRIINADLFPTDLEAARRHKPDAGLAVMPGVGHFPMLEDPAEFNRLLERAVRELTEASPTGSPPPAG